MEEWKEYRLGEITVMKNGKKRPQEKGLYPVYGGNGIMDYSNNYNSEKVIIVGRVGAYCGCVYKYDEKCWVSDNAIAVTPKDTVVFHFLYYLMSTLDLHHHHIGGAQPLMTQDIIGDFKIKLPSPKVQQQIVSVLKSLDDKIEVNRRINDNLEQQAMAIFDMMFPAVVSGEDVIGNVITPKRGKGLLSKDALEGNVPVVAGGLEPATYHNESNTVAPVVTISASGANAGFVNLWQIPVWSSDSSFIDASMTENVYFWYVMLKKRQKEIFDAQTGSAQPHIYPKHIAEMPMGNFEQSDVEKFTEIVTPMFEIRGRNLKESERLASLRDTLLPKLMSGELKLNEINV